MRAFFGKCEGHSQETSCLMQAADTVSTEINAEVWSQPVMAFERNTFLRPGLLRSQEAAMPLSPLRSTSRNGALMAGMVRLGFSGTNEKARKYVGARPLLPLQRA